VQQYTEKFYLKAYKNRKELIANNYEQCKVFTKWKANLLANWDKIKFVSVNHSEDLSEIKIGSKYKIFAEIEMGLLTKDDIEVQIYFGKLDNIDFADENLFETMQCVDYNNGNVVTKYDGSIKCDITGEFGYTLRILPKNPILINQFELDAIKWVEVK